MRRLLVFCAVLLALPMVLPASEFDWMTREFARQSGTKPMRIPFFGVAQFLVAVVHPAGASELKLAIFEHAHVDAVQFSRLADSTVGSQWKPIVRVRDSSGEMSNIYVQPDGKHLQVLVVSLEHDEAVFVQVRIRPEKLVEFIDQQRHHQA